MEAKIITVNRTISTQKLQTSMCKGLSEHKHIGQTNVSSNNSNHHNYNGKSDPWWGSVIIFCPINGTCRENYNDNILIKLGLHS